MRYDIFDSLDWSFTDSKLKAKPAERIPGTAEIRIKIRRYYYTF